MGKPHCSQVWVTIVSSLTSALHVSKQPMYTVNVVYVRLSSPTVTRAKHPAHIIDVSGFASPILRPDTVGRLCSDGGPGATPPQAYPDPTMGIRDRPHSDDERVRGHDRNDDRSAATTATSTAERRRSRRAPAQLDLHGGSAGHAVGRARSDDRRDGPADRRLRPGRRRSPGVGGDELPDGVD